MRKLASFQELERHDRQAGDHLEVAEICGCYLVTEPQRCSSNQQILEGDVGAASGLLALDAPRQFRDISRYRMHDHVAAEFLRKCLPSSTVCVTLGAIDAVRQFHQGHDRKRSVLFSVPGLHPLDDGLNTLTSAFPCNKHAGIEDYSHEGISRGLRLLMISSKSAAKSGSSVGS